MKLKIKFAISFVLLLIISSSCLITSLHPLYTKNDLVFNDTLLGTWTDDDSSTWVIERYFQPDIFGVENKKDSLKEKVTKTYKLTYISEKAGGELLLHISKLDNSFFIDFFPNIDGEEFLNNYFIEMHHLPVHSFGIIDINDSIVKINLLNEEWLSEKVESQEVDINIHEIEDWKLITSSTSEIQVFLIKYAKNKDAFDNEIVLRR